MADRKLPPEITPPRGSWWGSVVVAAIGIAAAVGYSRSREVHAAAGSPLYDTAVREALRGLTDTGGGNAAALPAGSRPPLPAGLSPADYYWCDKCKAYHKRQPEQALPATPAAAQAAGAAAPAAGIPPLPAGLSPADYYWCDKCKAYHKRQPEPAAPAPGTPAAVAPAAPAASPAVAPGHGGGGVVPASPAAGGERPPLPAGLSPADYYWCDQCKAYHPRKAADNQTPAPAAPPPAAPAAASPPAPPAAAPAAAPASPPPSKP